MQNYTTIIGVVRLRCNGASQRTIQSRYNIGSSTCQRILCRFKECGLSLEDLEKMGPAQVVDLFYPPDKLRRKDIPLPDFQAIHDRLMKKGSKANLFYLWTQYKKETPDGYQYSQFVEYYNRYVKEHYAARNVTMAVERIPGEKVFIDWVGDKPSVLYDPKTGELKELHVFVTTCGVSNALYAELFMDEKLPAFMAGTSHALEAYGAVPRFLVPDNAATAVTKHSKDELIINSSYQDLESFYNTIVLPPPVYKPRGKPTVEKHVQILETWLIEQLKENVYTSLEAANSKCREVVADINHKAIEGCPYTRWEMFEMYDKPQMKTLSDGLFSPCDYVAFKSVPANYHLKYDNHYYSVNYTYLGKPVILKATMTTISICDENNRLLCTHDRLYKTYPKYSTKSEHMPPDHRFYSEVNKYNGDYYRRWASAIGPEMSRMIEIVLHASAYEEQNYNACNGILHMCDGVPKYICNKAAAKCIELNSCKYTYFKRVMNEMMNEKKSGRDALPDHKNMRGKDFYK